MPLKDAKATIDGTIVIETSGEPFEIPITATIPPVEKGVFVFDTTKFTDLVKAPKVRIGEFITWLASAFGFDVSIDSLPASIQNLTIAIVRIMFNTAADPKFDVEIAIGTGEGEAWIPEWKPIADIGLTLKKFGLRATNEADAQAWIPALRALTDGAAVAAVAGNPAAPLRAAAAKRN